METTRLALRELTTNDAAFILELVNTPGWLQFIGDRNVKNMEDALAYINKILSRHGITYWVVTLKDGTPAGIITFIKRDYLPHHDIGFAFLPRYQGTGYALEAAAAVLKSVSAAHTRILATTIPGNASSIRLLTKLGLAFEKEITVEGEKLLVYGTQTQPR